MRVRSLATAALIFLVVLRAEGQSPKTPEPRITGTYSDMRYNEESGDVLGAEIRIVATSGGYQASVQFAEGVPEDLIVADVTVTGNKISFSIPRSYRGGAEFSGVIENHMLIGEFRFKTGGPNKVSLPRRKSYWD